MSQDVIMAAGWVKQGVEDGYFHADEVWRVLQHYYIDAFDIVRDHKAFLLEAMKLLGKTGWLSADAVMTLWNKFYKVEPQEKAKKETRLSIKDNAETITLTDLKGEPMKFTEHEIFVLHNTAARQAKREAGADAQNLWSPATTMGNRFAYVDGRRYDTYGMRDGIPYFLQRMGLMTVDKKGATTATIPDGILPPVAPLFIWAKDLLTVTERFAKSLDDMGSNPRVYLSPWEFIHLTENYPAPQDIAERVKTIRTLVQDIAVLDRELATAKQENDLLCRPVAGLTRHDDIKLRFLLELSLPALKAMVTRAKNDYEAAKPKNYDKMKKREQEKCGWFPSSATMLGRYVEKVTERQQLTFDELATVRYYLTATAAHAGWRIEAARRHPDQGGSAEASSVFGEIWDRLEKILPPLSCNEAAQAVAGAR
jgi:hypothetical protein